MLRDLSGYFLQSFSILENRNLEWRIRNLSKNIHIDWDFEDGEKWGSILKDCIRIAIFHSHLPIIFSILKKQQILEILENNIKDIVFVKIESWDISEYCITSEEILNKIEWKSVLNPSKISINDLWFATI